MRKSHFLMSLGSCGVLAFLCACDGTDQIKTYRVAKESAPAMPPAAAAPATDPMAPGAALPEGMAPPPPSQVTDTPPAGWERKPASSMRLASYSVKGGKGGEADVSLIVLAGAAGGPLDNVNRWLSQLSQPPVTEEKLATMAQHVKSPLGDVLVFDLRGAETSKDERILAGLVTRGDKSYFFKMRGPLELVGAQKSNFTQWIASAKSGEADAKAAAAAPDAAAVPGKPGIRWKVPGNWKSAPPASMRYASFTAAGPQGGTADISVVILPGESGGDLDNVNRWRKQAGLEPVDAEGLKRSVGTVKAGKTVFTTVDLPGPKQRIVAGWTLVDGKTWFFKMAGPDALVAAEKNNFTQFLESVQF